MDKIELDKMVMDTMGRQLKIAIDDREYFKIQLIEAFKLLRVTVNNIYDDEDELTIKIKKLISDNSHTAAARESGIWAEQEKLIFNE